VIFGPSRARAGGSEQDLGPTTDHKRSGMVARVGFALFLIVGLITRASSSSNRRRGVSGRRHRTGTGSALQLDSLLSTDHKRTAAKLALLGFALFLVAGLLALVMRGELAQPGLQVVSANTYDELFTIHGSLMIYFVMTPFALALGLYFVPLQIGAAEVAAPRLTAFGFWLIAGGAVTLLSGFLTDGGAGRGGWTAYLPLSGEQGTPGPGMDMWVIGVLLAALGSTVIAATTLATIFRHRAPGMSMFRIPPFSWAILFTCLMTVTAFPVLVVAMALLLAERLGAGILDPGSGPVLYQHLFWFYGHPVVYVMFFPFLGAVAEVVATFSQRRLFGYRPLVFSLLLFTGISMAVWAHHMFATGQLSTSLSNYFAFSSHLLAVPAGIEYFDLIATMIGGAILLRTPMLFALGFMAQFLIGGLTGIIVGSPPIDYHVHDSYFVVGHFHYTLFAGSLFGGFAGLYYWFPKITGVMLREGLGKAHFVLMAIGANLTFFPMLLLGYDGMPRRVADYPADAGFGTDNLLASFGAAVIALSILVFIVNLVVSLRRRRPAGDDPWRAQTLEWATSSPPPRLNFRSLPPIRSRTPLLDLRSEPGQ
jgi:cytochrome c oxidase subunit 1